MLAGIFDFCLLFVCLFVFCVFVCFLCICCFCVLFYSISFLYVLIDVFYWFDFYLSLFLLSVLLFPLCTVPDCNLLFCCVFLIFWEQFGAQLFSAFVLRGLSCTMQSTGFTGEIHRWDTFRLKMKFLNPMVASERFSPDISEYTIF